jgi:2-polyprenyl-3-methyl-5-hydroxy-6-metoxy-1,4-benzoquinol methylase
LSYQPKIFTSRAADRDPAWDLAEDRSGRLAVHGHRLNHVPHVTARPVRRLGPKVPSGGCAGRDGPGRKQAVAAADPAGGDYDGYDSAYAAAVARREQGGADADPFGILPGLLELLGPVDGRRVLDAGCGEGYLARALAARGAQVTGIDLSPRLIELARRKDPGGGIRYLVADLSRPLPESAGSFDAVASYLVLNDVRDYRGFVATLATVLKPGGRLALALNNPYGAVIHSHVADYFDSGAVSPYRGLWVSGPTIITARWRTISMRSWRRACGWPSWPISRPWPVSTGRTPGCRPASASRASCCWPSTSPDRRGRPRR